MDRRNILVVIIFIFLYQNCVPQQNFPKKFLISQSCFSSQTKLNTIIDGAYAWNKASCVEFFEYAGINQDKEFSGWDDLMDENLTVYCTGESNPWFKKLMTEINKNISGYSFGVYGDVVIETEMERINTNDEGTKEEVESIVLKGLVTHEFGHQLFLGHNDNESGYSVMNLDRPLGVVYPTRVDIYGFEGSGGVCDIYACPLECQTRPTK